MTKGLVVDSSALVGILLREPEEKSFLDLILAAEERWISAFSILETIV